MFADCDGEWGGVDASLSWPYHAMMMDLVAMMSLPSCGLMPMKDTPIQRKDCVLRTH